MNYLAYKTRSNKLKFVEIEKAFNEEIECYRILSGIEIKEDIFPLCVFVQNTPIKTYLLVNDEIEQNTNDLLAQTFLNAPKLFENYTFEENDFYIAGTNFFFVPFFFGSENGSPIYNPNIIDPNEQIL